MGSKGGRSFTSNLMLGRGASLIVVKSSRAESTEGPARERSRRACAACSGREPLMLPWWSGGGPPLAQASGLRAPPPTSQLRSTVSSSLSTSVISIPPPPTAGPTSPSGTATRRPGKSKGRDALATAPPGWPAPAASGVALGTCKDRKGKAWLRYCALQYVLHKNYVGVTITPVAGFRPPIIIIETFRDILEGMRERRSLPGDREQDSRQNRKNARPACTIPPRVYGKPYTGICQSIRRCWKNAHRPRNCYTGRASPRVDGQVEIKGQN